VAEHHDKAAIVEVDQAAEPARPERLSPWMRSCGRWLSVFDAPVFDALTLADVAAAQELLADAKAEGA
jgi:hypothetical protein